MTGMQLQYWVDSTEGSTSSILLQPGESSLLKIEACEKVVMIPSTRQQVIYSYCKCDFFLFELAKTGFFL